MSAKQNDPNKHGLRRYIDMPIRQQIRKDAGYGCVICGTLFCDFEHIDPEFNDAKKHDPAKMTLLCESCHGKVTGKRKSKRRVWEAKANPFCKTHGVLREEIEPCISPTFEMGSSLFHDVEIVLSVHGKPLMWLDSPSDKDEPFEVSAIFHDNEGKYVASLNRNQFTSILGSHDIWGKGTRIEIRPQKGVVGLTLNIEGDKPVNIERINMNYLGSSLVVDKDGTIILDNNNRIGRLHVESGHTAICIGRIPETKLRDNFGSYSLLTVAYLISRQAKIIQTINGNQNGWLLGNCILNTNLKVVGFHKHGKAFAITEEYIGELIPQQTDKFLLASSTSEYESYEPIWVSFTDQQTRNIRIDPNVDVTHRVFGITPMKRVSKLNRDHLLPEHKASYQQTSDATKMGDRVTINFEGKIDGVPFEGGKAENFPLVIGEGRMIQGFENGLLGKKYGESFELQVVFPDDYHAENLKGKHAVFSISLVNVERHMEITG
ncbi:hypothetical protein BA893_22025 [Vibrio natriegens]|uniref:FKBP-type peptidyl-prolyl cis-trans isomerase n=1 Tax=Vibrio natriegens TaxID=691 RepID=UPI000803CFE4|nr:FKBP-type peptidyl-prolyl cis-trans isomerase [Vibrio natriegens]ANQ24292.1 hypothetical protein BA893_22025 [Vibrio natriegens]